MKKSISLLLILVMVLSLAACGGSGSKDNGSSAASVDSLVADYGFQWTDPNAPILNDKGAEELSFRIYSSKNASALDYNDMKIMQDLYASTNVTVNFYAMQTLQTYDGRRVMIGWMQNWETSNSHLPKQE